MKVLQLVRILARVLLLLAGTGAAAIGALPFAPQGYSGPTRELPASALTNVAAPAAPAAESGRVVAGGRWRHLRRAGRGRAVPGAAAQRGRAGTGPTVWPPRERLSGAAAGVSAARVAGTARRGLVRADAGHGAAARRRRAGPGAGFAAGGTGLGLGLGPQRVADRAAQQAAAVAGGRGLWKCGTESALRPSQWRTFNYQNKRRYGVGCTW